MKKILTLLAATVLLAGAANAQSLGSILSGVASAASSAAGSSDSGLLGTLSKVIYAYTGKTDAVSLPGSWTYTGPAIALGSDSALSNLAGTAVSSGMESKVEGYLQKVGITSGSIQFTFNEDLTFDCKMKGIPMNGTWRTSDDNSTITLQFGKTFKYLSMTGALKNTATGCEMLFEGTRFLNFIKTAMSIVGKQSATASAVSGLAGNYSNMQIGFKLKKI